MRTILIILALFLLFNSSYSQNGWVQVYDNPNIIYEKAFFLNQNTGWVCGDSGKVVKTTNGGFNWIRYRANTVHAFNDIFFLNENTGWAVGGTQNFSGFCFTMSARTFDGGISWTVSEAPSYDNTLRFIYFQNINTGFILGGGTNGGAITGFDAQTTNAGINWTQSPDISTQFNYLRKTSNGVFLREYQKWADAGYISDSVFIQYSTNNGLSWITKSKFNGYQIFGIDLADENSFSFYVRAAIPPNQYGLLRSTNGGLNWFVIPREAGFTFANIYFYNSVTGWCTSNGGLYKTTNGGYNWTNQLSSGGMVYMRDSLNGFCFSTNGKIFITGTGGITNISGQASLPSNFSLSQNYPNPFNPSTTINYQLPIPNYVSIKVYDALGNEVETLVNEKQNAGSYSVDFNAASLPSGIYFYKLVTEKFSETKKMILIK